MLRFSCCISVIYRGWSYVYHTFTIRLSYVYPTFAILVYLKICTFFEAKICTCRFFFVPLQPQRFFVYERDNNEEIGGYDY